MLPVAIVVVVVVRVIYDLFFIYNEDIIIGTRRERDSEWSE